MAARVNVLNGKVVIPDSGVARPVVGDCCPCGGCPPSNGTCTAFNESFAQFTVDPLPECFSITPTNPNQTPWNDNVTFFGRFRLENEGPEINTGGQLRREHCRPTQGNVSSVHVRTGPVVLGAAGGQFGELDCRPQFWLRESFSNLGLDSGINSVIVTRNFTPGGALSPYSVTTEWDGGNFETFELSFDPPFIGFDIIFDTFNQSGEPIAGDLNWIVNEQVYRSRRVNVQGNVCSLNFNHFLWPRILQQQQTGSDFTGSAFVETYDWWTNIVYSS